MDFMTVTQMQTVQTQMGILSVLATMDFLGTGKVALVKLMTMHRNLSINNFWFYLDDTSENLVPCPCNSPESCFSFDNNGTEVCGCYRGYVRQLDSETCTGMMLPNNLVITMLNYISLLIRY